MSGPRDELTDLVTRIRDDVERVDPGAANGHCDLLPTPRQPVGALAADLHRRGGGDRQLDLAPEGFEPCLELLSRGRIVTFAELAFRVAGRGRRGEVDVRDVALVEPDEAWRQLS